MSYNRRLPVRSVSSVRLVPFGHELSVNLVDHLFSRHMHKVNPVGDIAIGLAFEPPFLGLMMVARGLQ